MVEERCGCNLQLQKNVILMAKFPIFELLNLQLSNSIVRKMRNIDPSYALK